MSGDQLKLSERLHRGVVFSLIWLGGIGSLYSFVVGIRALKQINRSNGRLSGRSSAWWCILVGGAGASFLAFVCIGLTLHLIMELLRRS